jgi:N-acetyl-gamma-glutamyl-phosphate reductase
MAKITVGVWGATGFAGHELVGILRDHPQVGSILTPARDEAVGPRPVDTAFLALPHGTSAPMAAELRVAGSTVIDLSGDLRFANPKDYQHWYHQAHPVPELLPVPYGLPELYRHEFAASPLVSLPGCYPTAVLLAVVPLLDANLVKPDTKLVVDAVSGVSGAGKQSSELTHFMTMHNNAIPYSIGRGHRHVGEMERFLQGHQVFFSPTLIPVERGIIVKVTVALGQGVEPATVRAALTEAYTDEAFVSVMAEGELPTIKDTAGMDGCLLGIEVIDGMVQVVASLDNLRKGAASQAVQVFNILHGLPETSGLTALAQRAI